MEEPKHILITGGTGFIGKILCPRLQQKGYHVLVLTRNPAKHRERESESLRFLSSVSEISNDTSIDTIINLAGEPLGEGKWTEERKKTFLSSRVRITQELIDLMQRLERKPKQFLSSSAVGFYGPQGDTILVEDSAPVDCYLYQLCKKWEEVALQARDIGVRCCVLRIGIVLGAHGGPLAELSLPFRWKVAAQLGDGRQWMPWIHLEDIIGVVFFLMENPTVEGVCNLSAPNPVTNAEFCQILGTLMRTWISVRVPAGLVSWLAGELADEILLVSQRVLPRKLEQAEYSFQYPHIKDCLQSLIS